MAQIIHFMPKAESSAQENMAEFIRLAKGILAGYPKVRTWEENNWDLEGVVSVSTKGDARIGAAFTTHDGVNRKGAEWLSQPFLDFAKAYFLYSNALRTASTFKIRLSALRVLEKALLKATGVSDLHQTTPAVLNLACNIAQERFGRGPRYGVGREVQKIGEFLVDKRLVSTPFQWRHPFEIPTFANRVSPEADRARKEKLPSEAALDALPRCFVWAETPQDLLVSSIAALLCCAPDRIGEVLAMPVDCEVEQEHKGKQIYGLRWWPEKGGEPMVKWITPTMVDVAKLAIARIRAITQPARDIAAWHEDHPGRMLLPEGLEHFRDQKLLTVQDLMVLLDCERTFPRTWLVAHKVPIVTIPGRRGIHARFEDVERAFLEMLPLGFPVFDQNTGTRFSKALFVLRRDELHAVKRASGLMVERLPASTINWHLGSSPKGEGTLFSRMGFAEPDGSPIKVTTHQFRHWLNTLAHQKGLSQLDIAKWSGRKDIRQNQAYDHMTSTELVEMARGLTRDDPRLFGPLAELAVRVPVTQEDFMALEFPAAHTTDIGFCVHDFTLLPCQKARDCINCTEHVCVKGDSGKTKRIREQLTAAEAALHRIREAVREGEFGADRWEAHQVATVERLEGLLGALDDPAVPQGALIRLLNPDEHFPVRMALLEGTGRSHIGNDRLPLGMGAVTSLHGGE
jgi:hypothetical protein